MAPNYQISRLFLYLLLQINGLGRVVLILLPSFLPSFLHCISVLRLLLVLILSLNRWNRLLSIATRGFIRSRRCRCRSLASSGARVDATVDLAASSTPSSLPLLRRQRPSSVSHGGEMLPLPPEPTSLPRRDRDLWFLRKPTLPLSSHLATKKTIGSSKLPTR